MSETWLTPVTCSDCAHIDFLYAVLAIRLGNDGENISHQKMPSYTKHCQFVASSPYARWYIILDADTDEKVGVIYLTQKREIGVFIMPWARRRLHAKHAVEEIIKEEGYPIYANINPRNSRSICFFKRLGFDLKQVVYCRENDTDATADGVVTVAL